MKRVIVIFLLSIILAMLMSRRENLTPKCLPGYTLNGMTCMGPCPGGAVAEGATCKTNTCPAGKVSVAANCCAKSKNGQFVNCTPKFNMRAMMAPKMV